jgi:DNA helicase-2/ATP-dependent DNA helicase PcrA
MFPSCSPVSDLAPNPVENTDDPLLSGLNPPQREAVLTCEGPVLMLAGAGTGKTAALTARLAHLVRSRRAWPSEILCVTFTNKAAREMRERVGHLIGPAVEGMPWLGTFHSIAAKMLRRHAELVGLQSNYTIIDTDDQLRLLKQLIQANDLDEKRWPARQLAGLIDRWKNRGLSPDQLDAAENEAYANGRGTQFYTLYQDRLKALNACDFGDLLLHMVTIFRSHREVLEQYQQRFKYILVDEYQDTNQVQYLWLRLLAQVRQNICVVGDDDQSIYSWRGAEVANILRFEGFSRSGGDPARAELPLDAANPRGRLGTDRGEQRAAWQDPVDRAAGGTEGARDRRVGRARGSAPGRRGDRAARA